MIGHNKAQHGRRGCAFFIVWRAQVELGYVVEAAILHGGVFWWDQMQNVQIGLIRGSDGQKLTSAIEGHMLTDFWGVTAKSIPKQGQTNFAQQKVKHSDENFAIGGGVFFLFFFFCFFANPLNELSSSDAGEKVISCNKLHDCVSHNLS